MSINVYSEIGKLKKVLVHTPGREIENISPSRLDELLFSALLESNEAREEHKKFVDILEKEGVEVIQLVNLIADTYNNASNEVKNQFIEQWLNEVEPKITSNDLREKIKKYLLEQKNTKNMIQLMMGGIFANEIGVSSKTELIVDPMPNLYFTRDPFASIGNGVTLHKMKYKTRRRETIFSQFIFNNHPDYKDVPRYSDREATHTVEGGDIFIYNNKTLVIGVSERTEIEEIKEISKKLIRNKVNEFEKIVAINVPKMKNLMHLDTWITMVDHDKFLYSPNVMGTLKMWEISLKNGDHEPQEISTSLEKMLEKIIGKKPILIPVAGSESHQIDVDIETHFDATNYLVISPGVVVGYDRNKKTAEALKKAGVKVIGFHGNQLSLGMGSARCMSMPLLREKA